MGQLDGKVALVTGGARGLGRNHAVRFAKEGATLVIADLCSQIASVPYPMSTKDDLAETVSLIEAAGAKVISGAVDIRDFDSLDAFVGEAVSELGGLDVAVANAGISSVGVSAELPEQTWQDMIDVNLTGVWHTTKAVTRHLLASKAGGSLILVSSAAATNPPPNISHYAAAKAGVVGLAGSLANELGPRGVRVNCVLPTTVDTPMVANQATYDLFAGGEGGTRDHFNQVAGGQHLLPTPCVQPDDITAAVLYLASDQSRFVHGINLPIDAGLGVKFPAG